MRTRLVPVLLVLLVLTGCDSGTQPIVADVYALRSIGNQPLSAVLDASPFRRIELVGGFLDLQKGGHFVVSAQVRITGADAMTREHETRSEGEYRRTGDSLHLTFTNGAEQVYLVEDQGARLRLTAERCADLCLDHLRPYVYERAAVIN